MRNLIVTAERVKTSTKPRRNGATPVPGRTWSAGLAWRKHGTYAWRRCQDRGMARDRDVAAFGERAPAYEDGWRGACPDILS